MKVRSEVRLLLSLSFSAHWAVRFPTTMSSLLLPTNNKNYINNKILERRQKPRGVSSAMWGNILVLPDFILSSLSFFFFSSSYSRLLNVYTSFLSLSNSYLRFGNRISFSQNGSGPAARGLVECYWSLRQGFILFWGTSFPKRTPRPPEDIYGASK